MCRLLFDSPKVNDALLFMTILSTDLRALRRRGYNGRCSTVSEAVDAELASVDRILRQQKADRLAAENAARARATLVSQSTANSSADTLVSAPPKPDGKPGGALPVKDTLIKHEQPNIVDEGPKHASRPLSTIRQSLDKFKWKRKGDDASIAGPSNDSPGLLHADTQTPLLPPPRPDRPHSPNPHATPRNSISKLFVLMRLL